MSSSGRFTDTGPGGTLMDPQFDNDHPEGRPVWRGMGTERLAVIAAARQFLAAHDRVIASDPVTRDDTFAMKNAADTLRDVLREYDDAPGLVACPACPHWMHLHEADGSCGGGCHGPLAPEDQS